ncbi:MAG: hypothetical protein IRZ28_13705 [Steroidobacteraceae bacterium]|nr:hypothetical protein [Steroidobacteraceae bacterium]
MIGRAKFAQRLQLAGLSATALVQDYARLAEIVEPAPLSGVSRDPDDDVVLAAEASSSFPATSTCSTSALFATSASSTPQMLCARSTLSR